jgi:hypothetical protein
MMKRDDRLEPAISEGAKHTLIVISGLGIPLSLLGLESAPLDGEPMRVVAPRFGEIEVVFEELIVTAGIARRVRKLPALLVLPPIAPTVVTLDLVA